MILVSHRRVGSENLPRKAETGYVHFNSVLGEDALLGQGELLAHLVDIFGNLKMNRVK